MSDSDKWCRHYNGLHNDNCNADVKYKNMHPDGNDINSYHCMNPQAITQCPKHELRTQAEIDENNHFAADYLLKHNALWTREGDECPSCGENVTSAKQVGRCVYASCGCRMGQGTLHKNWLKEGDGE